MHKSDAFVCHGYKGRIWQFVGEAKYVPDGWVPKKLYSELMDILVPKQLYR